MEEEEEREEELLCLKTGRWPIATLESCTTSSKISDP